MEIITIQPFLDYYKRIRHRTMEVVALVPEDQVEWSYASGKFSFGDIIRHIATIERFMYAENMLNRPSSYAGCGVEVAKGYPGIIRFMDDLHQESLSIFASLTPGDLQSKCNTPGGATITKWKWLRAMVEHEVHHRGQLFVYLGLIGVKSKPIYGLTSEEVQAKSAGSGKKSSDDHM
jgi:uncharacterized damage-inducible protein DinB